MKFVYICCLTIVLMISGCATPYTSNGLLGGFSETQLAPDIFRVSFQGNGFTSIDKTKDFGLLRAAELTISNGYSYFAIIDSTEEARSLTIQTPVTADTRGTITPTSYGASYQATTTYSGGDNYSYILPKSGIMIVLLHQKPAGAFAFDANFLISSLKSKYGLK